MVTATELSDASAVSYGLPGRATPCGGGCDGALTKVMTGGAATDGELAPAPAPLLPSDTAAAAAAVTALFAALDTR
ncbi:MAG: hypothetical protein EOO41_01935, partial [Methanobacteriota archaeon]